MRFRKFRISREGVWLSASVGLVQGVLAYFFFEHLKFGTENRYWLTPLRTLVVLLPITLPLLAGTVSLKKAFQFMLLQGVVLGGMAVYAAYAYPDSNDMAQVGAFFCVPLVWWLSLVLYTARARAVDNQIPFYPCMFSAKIGICAALAFTGIFVGIFWALLMLWGQLFKIVGITLFWELFRKEFFGYVATSTAVAFGIALSRPRFLDAMMVPRHLLGFGTWLLPLASFIIVLFLVSLPFTGLQALWNTGHATALMLSLQLLMLGLVLSTYQDGTHASPYGPALKKLLKVALIAQPAYALLSAYAVYLRVAQYGWTVDRVWAALVVTFALAAGLGYAYAAIYRGAWLKPVERTNIALAGLILAVAVLTHTPVLSPARIAAASQMAQLLSDKIAATKFDYGYLRFNAGIYGKKALEALSAREGEGDAATIRREAKAALEKTNRWEQPKAGNASLLKSRIVMFPAGAEAEESFLQALIEANKQDGNKENLYTCLNPPYECPALKADLDGDGQHEYVLLTYQRSVYALRSGKWTRIGQLSTTGYEQPQATLKALREKGFELKEPLWKDLTIGTRHYSVTLDPTEEKKNDGNSPQTEP